MTALPPAFLQLQGFARNDLKQIRKLDKESPVYAVGVLVAIATEALSQLEGRGDDAVFAEDLLGLRHGVPVLVGRVLFDAVRNGLAHAYDTRTVVLGSEEVVVVLSWEQRGHLSVASEDWFRDGKLRRGLCLNVGTLWADLDAHFSEFSQRLEQDAELRQRHRQRGEAEAQRAAGRCAPCLARLPLRAGEEGATAMNNIEPMAPTLGREPFHRAGWVYEEKVDGWRIVAYRDGARVRLVSRHGVDHTRHFRDIAAAIAKLSARSLVLDGEVAIFDQQLRSRFDWLRDPDPDAVATPPLLMAFDLALCLRATLPVALRHALPRRSATTTTGSARRASTTSGSTSDGRCLARVGLRDAHGRLPRLWRGRIR